jgi:hypothetical protein
MKYDTSSPREAGEAVVYLNDLIREKKKVEIKAVKPRRSLPQNSYLHLLLGAFGSHFGMSMDEAKGVYKRLPGNKDIYIKLFDRDGIQFEYERSSASLDKLEMMKSIDTLREWSAKMGYPLPSAEEREWLMSLENTVEQHERYL